LETDERVEQHEEEEGEEAEGEEDLGI